MHIPAIHTEVAEAATRPGVTPIPAAAGITVTGISVTGFTVTGFTVAGITAMAARIPFRGGGWGDLGSGGGYPYYGDDGYYPYASDYPYYPSYGGGYPYYGGYPYDYGYYPGKDKYGKPNAQLSELEAQKAERQTSEQEYNDSKEMPVLKQTWVVSGKTALAFNGGVRIVTHKASDKDGCQKDSAAVSYLTSDTDIKKLCLKTGETENFTYQDKNYLFNLSGIAAQANEYRYSISISSER